jgi:heme-degrading monooxygenase HmoA
MIARVWRGQTLPENADAYFKFVTGTVFPELRTIPGHEGAFVQSRSVNGGTEFLVTTLWRSMEAIKKFAGENPDVAVVEPPARAVLAEFDSFVRHYEVVYGSESLAGLRTGASAK